MSERAAPCEDLKKIDTQINMGLVCMMVLGGSCDALLHRSLCEQHIIHALKLGTIRYITNLA